MKQINSIIVILALITLVHVFQCEEGANNLVSIGHK